MSSNQEKKGDLEDMRAQCSQAVSIQTCETPAQDLRTSVSGIKPILLGRCLRNMASLILFSAQLAFLMMVLQKVQLKKRVFWIDLSSCPPNHWLFLCAGNKALICRGYSCQDVYHSGLYTTATVLVLNNKGRMAVALCGARCQEASTGQHKQSHQPTSPELLTSCLLSHLCLLGQIC